MEASGDVESVMSEMFSIPRVLGSPCALFILVSSARSNLRLLEKWFRGQSCMCPRSRMKGSWNGFLVIVGLGVSRGFGYRMGVLLVSVMSSMDSVHRYGYGKREVGDGVL